MTPLAADAPGSPQCDPFGRPVHDLRISVTSACDLRCWFCHREGMVRNGRSMTPSDVRTLGRTASQLGVRFVKLTGGEPLLRPDLEDIVRHLSPLFEEVSLVTNGQTLASRARGLQAAGLRRVNVSLHTVDPDVYRHTTGGSIEPVLQGIRAAAEAGLSPVKVNVVATHETLKRLDDVLAWARPMNVTVQLIELHTPPGTSPRVPGERVPLIDLQRTLEQRGSFIGNHRLHGRRRYRVDGVNVEVTRPEMNPSFCAACTRLRLTHDGYLKPCLMRADNHVDILGPLRAGALQSELDGIFMQAVARRAPFWRTSTPPAFTEERPDRAEPACDRYG